MVSKLPQHHIIMGVKWGTLVLLVLKLDLVPKHDIIGLIPDMQITDYRLQSKENVKLFK